MPKYHMQLRQRGKTPFGRSRPHVRIPLLILPFLLILTACGGSIENGKGSARLGSSAGRTAPPIAIAGLSGIPLEKAQQLNRALVYSAGKRNVSLTGKTGGGLWRLSGEFVPGQSQSGVGAVHYAWVLTDADGQVLHRISGVEVGQDGAGHGWASVNENAIRRIAGHTAENLASRLTVLGFATQAGGLPPPSHALQRAGEGAEKELDYETLYGPGRTVPPSLAIAQAYGDTRFTQPVVPTLANEASQAATASLREPVSRPPKAVPPPVPVQSAKLDADKADRLAPTAPASKKVKRGPNIDSVAVTTVSGSPGRGNQQLLSALRRTLRQAGWPVHVKARKDALTITGEVSLSEPKDGTQNVSLAWTVKTPDGKVLGTIKQANSVPAGSLQNGWGENAVAVGQAAATGIFDVVQKAQRGG